MNVLQDPLFRALFDTPVPRIILKANAPQYTIVTYNEAFKTSANINAGDITGRSLADVYHPAQEGSGNSEILRAALEQAVSTKSSVHMSPFRYDIPAPDGAIIEAGWWQLVIAPVAGDNGEVIHLLITIHNITDKVSGKANMDRAKAREQGLAEQLEATNEELSASNEELSATIEELRVSKHDLQELNVLLEGHAAERAHRLKAMVMTTPVGMTVFRGRDLIIEIANQHVMDIWGRTADQVYDKPLLEVFPELLDQPFPQMLRDVFDTGKPIGMPEIPVLIASPQGDKNIFVSFSYDPLFDTQGRVEAILVTVMDITASVVARRQLEESEAEQQALNEELAATNEELTATNEELAAVNEEHAATNEELNAANAELSRSQRDLHKALLEIKYNEEKLKQILGQLPALVVVLTGPDHIVELANDALLRFWRRTREQVMGRSVLTVFPELRDQPFPALWKHVLNTGELITHRERPVIFKNDDGTDRLSYVDYYYQPFNNAEGVRTGVLATVVDVTDKVTARKQLEASQTQQQALNEELAASVEELRATNEELAASREELNKAVAELAESESRLRYMLSEAPTAIALMTGRDLIIESANKLALKIWGKTEAVIGRPLRSALAELQGRPFLDIVDEVYNTGVAYYGNDASTIIERNGVPEEVFFDLVYYPLKNKEGKTHSIMLVANITTDKVIARREMERAEEMLRFSIEAADVGTWFLDVNTRELVLSPRLKEMFGFYGNEEVSYDDLLAQIPDGHHYKIRHAIEAALIKGHNYSMEHPVTGKHDGKKRWLRGIGKLYPDAEGKLSHFSGLMIDITEQKMDELRKNDFIGMVSHELKTPLTTVTAIVQMIGIKAQKNGDAFTANALERANIQVKKMANMINGFLSISRLESGKMLIEKRPLDIATLLQDVVAEAQLTVVTHRFILGSCPHIMLEADRDKIASVVSNLLSNAVKYSPKSNEVNIDCEVSGEYVQISIRDHGIGINEQDIERLFERYYRVENSATQHISGFGIGLYLSAEIIKYHNGRIWAQSEPGAGSTFYFTLPLS